MPIFFPNTGSSGSGGFPNVFNYTSPATQLVKWRKAIANVKTGQGNARIMCVGDSTTFGVGTGSSTSVGDMKPFSYPTQLANRLNAIGINAHANSFAGYGQSSGLPNNFINDARIVAGNSWVPHTFPTVGGEYLKASTSTNSLAFTPTVPVDTFKIITPVGAFGHIGFDINGGTQTNVDETVGPVNGFVETVITGTLGTNTLNIKYISGATVFLVGVEAYDSSKKWVDVYNVGWSGAKSVDLSAATVLSSYPWIAPDLSILNCGINDWNFGVSIATFTTQVQSIITALKAIGDVVLVAPNPSDTNVGAGASVAVQQTFVAALYALASTNNLPLFDLFNRMQGTYALDNAAGYAADNVHLNKNGYADAAQFLANILATP